MELKNERKYEFRKRMRQLHRSDRRDFSLRPADDELVLANGCQLVLPADCGEVALTAAQDFLEYMLVSMEVSVLLCKTADNGGGQKIVLSVASDQKEDYVISVGEAISVTGRNERGLAQGLYCLEDKMNLRRAPYLKKEEIRHSFLFSPRMVHSGYGLDQYPNEHLSAIAHAGMDAILIFVKDVNYTPSGFLDFNELIERAAKYGLDVYAYSYLKSKKHPEDSDAEAHYEASYGRLFQECPGLKGVTLVGESVEFPSHDPHISGTSYKDNTVEGIPTGKVSPGWYPCCDYPQWLELLKKVVRRHKPDADIVFWTYNWGYVAAEERIKLIESLPTDISLQVTYEMFETYQLGSFKQTVADYSLAFSGPGYYFLTEAEAAKKRGIRLYAMTNTGGLTWDMGTIPYEPMPYQWMERYRGLREANEKYGLCGLMESHHFGLWPSFISDLAKQCYIAENTSLEACLADVISARYGAENTETICSALKLWSEAIRCYTPSDADQYGAFRCGPSYPLCLVKAVKPQSEPFAHFGSSILEVLYPADYAPTCPIPMGRGMLPSLRLDGELQSLDKMLSCMEEGLAILKGIASPNEELLYLINLGEYICCCVQTGIHAKKWYLTTGKLKVETDRNKLPALIDETKALLAAEYANAERALPLTEKDSRLGWEPSMDYIADPAHIRWKLRYLDYVRDVELKCYENGSAQKWYE